jgi:hypothetical protein
MPATWDRNKTRAQSRVSGYDAPVRFGRGALRVLSRESKSFQFFRTATRRE